MGHGLYLLGESKWQPINCSRTNEIRRDLRGIVFRNKQTYNFISTQRTPRSLINTLVLKEICHLILSPTFTTTITLNKIRKIVCFSFIRLSTISNNVYFNAGKRNVAFCRKSLSNR